MGNTEEGQHSILLKWPYPSPVVSLHCIHTSLTTHYRSSNRASISPQTPQFLCSPHWSSFNIQVWKQTFPGLPTSWIRDVNGLIQSHLAIENRFGIWTHICLTDINDLHTCNCLVLVIDGDELLTQVAQRQHVCMPLINFHCDLQKTLSSCWSDSGKWNYILSHTASLFFFFQKYITNICERKWRTFQSW